MRARNIKPGFFTDDDLVECSFAARLLYVGLWCMADRMGRLEDRPKKIRMHIFPADDVDCAALLAELEGFGKIKRYEVDGRRVIWIPGFLQHQHPHPNEKASAIPRHTDDENAEWKPKGESGDGQGKKDFTPRHEALHSKDIPTQADSLIPDSLNSLSERDARGWAPEAGEPETPNLASEFGVDFQEFLEAYPAHRTAGNEVDAGRAWLAERKAKRLLSPMAMLAALDGWKRSEDWTREDGRFVCTPQKWLSGRKYLSRPPVAAGSSDDPDGSKRAARDKARTMAMLAAHDQPARASPPPRPAERAAH